MNRFLKLVHFEFQRFIKLYLVLMGVIILLQFIGVMVESQNYLKQVNEHIHKGLMPKEQFIEQFGTFSFLQIAHSFWFMGPIALCITALMIYVFFIWYRDWLGKNTFIYRLFMLPTSRLNVYFAKAAVILLFIFGLLAIQLLLMPIENRVLQWMVPNEYFNMLSINEIINIDYLSIIYPPTFIEFILYYGGGMIAVFIVFTAILFERSFRLKGIIYGILYTGLSSVIFLAPILVNQLLLEDYFFPLEIFFMEVVMGLIVLAGAIWTARFLLKNKIRV
ncbi:hypothetical protein [Niallia endozanthoxylica]|uniref:Uncharacterized protein n=1 Tax=Niallia endozanthoxylica TaxID=2036016 RepID=A0A5J5HJ35_9BACI|nr:hypothetical protein [Niallia endozanthoxylica]KAA9019504.1 hypothetical protein F4V44_19340 [Niallia endozanthoxylica]